MDGTASTKMSNSIDYEQLVEAELAAASRGETIDQRRRHLDQVAVYAASGEMYRGENVLPVIKQ